jgi:hypothetical protein
MAGGGEKRLEQNQAPEGGKTSLHCVKVFGIRPERMWKL